jgi:hypothetical protein
MKIRAIGGCRVNGIGFDLYVNRDGSATIKPEKQGTPLPKRYWMHFTDLESAERYIESTGLTGAALVHQLKKETL